MNAQHQNHCMSMSDPANNRHFRRQWDTPEPFVQIGDAAAQAIRETAIRAALRIVEEAEKSEDPAIRRSLAGDAAVILRMSGLTPGDLARRNAA